MTHDSTDPSMTELLLREVKRGDHVALDRLLALHREEVHRIVSLRLDRRISARTDSSDVVQETLLEVANRMPEYLERSPMPFRVWLRCTALEKLRDVRRRHLTQGRSVLREAAIPEDSARQLADRLAAKSSSPSNRLQMKEALQKLRQAIEELSEEDEEIVLMRWVENLPYAEIGLVMSISPAAARQRHGRALKRLGQILRKHKFSQGDE